MLAYFISQFSIGIHVYRLNFHQTWQRFFLAATFCIALLLCAFQPIAHSRVGGVFGGEKVGFGVLPDEIEQTIYNAMQFPGRMGILTEIVARNQRFAASMARLAATLQPQRVGSILKVLVKGAPAQVEEIVRALVQTVPHATRVIIQTAVESYPESAADVTLGGVDIHPDRVIEISYIAMKTAATLRPEKSATIAGQLADAMIERDRGQGQAVAQVIVRAALSALAEAIPEPKTYTDIAIDVCENIITSVMRHRPKQTALYLQLVLREAIFTASRADRRKRIRMENTAAAVVLYRIVAKLAEDDLKVATDTLIDLAVAAAQVSPHTMLHLASAVTQGATERVMKNRQDSHTSVLETSVYAESVVQQYVTMRPHLMSELLQVVLQTAIVTTGRQEIATADLLSESLPARLSVVAVNAASRQGPDALAPLSADAARAALSIVPEAVVDVAVSLATQTPVGSPYRKAQAGPIALSLVRSIVPAFPESADALVVALTSIAPASGDEYSTVAKRLGARGLVGNSGNSMVSAERVDPDFYAIEDMRSATPTFGAVASQDFGASYLNSETLSLEGIEPHTSDVMQNLYAPSKETPHQKAQSKGEFHHTASGNTQLLPPDVLVPIPTESRSFETEIPSE